MTRPARCGNAPRAGLSDDELYHISDLLPDDLNLWSDLEEGRTYFTGRDYTWWRDVLGHPKAHRGCCKTCGCATSCMFGLFHESVVMSVIQELARIGLIRGLPTMDCPRVDAEDKHGDHSWIDAEMGPAICDGYDPEALRRFLLANATALRAELDGLDLSDAEVEARLAAAHAQAEQRKAGEGT